MSRIDFGTFGDHLRQFAWTADIIYENTYKEILSDIKDHLKDQLDVWFMSVTVEKMVRNQPGLYGEWPSSRIWWDNLVKEDGVFTSHTALAYSIGKPLWIVGEAAENLKDTTAYHDLTKNVQSSQICKYAQIDPDEASKTSIILPLKSDYDRIYGVLNVESERYLEYSDALEKELRKIADAISILRQLMKVCELQKKNTQNARNQLRRNYFVPVIPIPTLFFAHSARAPNDVVGLINEVVHSFQNKGHFQIESWTTPDSGNIIDRLWQFISTCTFAICYLSELPGEEEGEYNDNANVLFEAGMLFSLMETKRSSVQHVIFIRESRSKEIPFDLSTESFIKVHRSDNNQLNSEKLKSELNTVLERVVA